jgi:Mg2+/citrate symporter
MANEIPPNDVKTLWQHQQPKEIRMSVDEIRKRAEQYRKRVHRRTLLGSAIAYSLIACFVLALFVLPNVLARTGSCLTIVACAYMLYQLHRRRGEALSPQSTGVAGIRAYRTELERQRDFHRGRWFWSRLLIFVPSYLLFIAGFAIAHPELAKVLAAIAMVAVIVAILAVPLQQKESKWYQRRIDELDALEK